MKTNKLYQAVAVGSILAGASTISQAAVDISAITSAGTDIAVVGAAVFIVYVAVKAFHWIRRAL